MMGLNRAGHRAAVAGDIVAAMSMNMLVVVAMSCCCCMTMSQNNRRWLAAAAVARVQMDQSHHRWSLWPHGRRRYHPPLARASLNNDNRQLAAHSYHADYFDHNNAWTSPTRHNHNPYNHHRRCDRRKMASGHDLVEIRLYLGGRASGHYSDQRPLRRPVVSEWIVTY